MGRPRRTKFGRGTRFTRSASATTHAMFKPTDGWSDQPPEDVGPASIVSGQNIWIKEGSRLKPRHRLSQLGTNTPTVDVANGAFVYEDVSGDRFPIVTSQGTVSFLDHDSWVTLTYASGVSDLPPSGGENDTYLGTSVYLARRDLNIAVLTNGVDPLYAWGGPSDNTAFSTLTEAPIAADVVLFDNSPVAWNIRELSSASRFVNRVQWPTGASPEDWTGIGSGFEDLVDMHGEGTRIFATEDQMVLATDKELQTGQRLGTTNPFRFSFAPLERAERGSIGIPFKQAAIHIPHGIFWLNNDYMVYQLEGNRIQAVGQQILVSLRETLQDFHRVRFGYNPEQQQLTLYYSTSNTAYPQRAFTLHLDSQKWTPQRYAHEITGGFGTNIPSSGTTWGALVSTLDTQTLTYNQLLGNDGTADEALTTSDGTAYFFSSTESLDDTTVVTAQAVTGGMFTADMENTKYVSEARVDLRGTSASSLTIGFSGNLGGAFATNTEFAVSVQSNTTQQLVPTGLSGAYHAMEFTSDDTGWEVNRVRVKATVTGEHF